MQDLEFEIDLLSQLVQLNTDSTLEKPEYDECAKLITEVSESSGLSVTKLNSKDFARDGKSRPILVIEKGVEENEKIILLEAHYDIVPPGNESEWTVPPLELTVKGDKAFGRGTADDKAGIVCGISAMKRIKNPQYGIRFLVTPDEEIGGKFGIGYAMKEVGITGDAGIILDADCQYVSLGCSGIIWGKITVKGKQGHAGYPEKARNAVHDLYKLGYHLLEFQEQRESIISYLPAWGSVKSHIYGRFSLTMVNAGYKENIIPGEAETRFDLRLIPEEDPKEAENTFMKFFEEKTKELDIDASFEKIQLMAGYHTDKTHWIAKSVIESAEKVLGSKIPVAGEFGGNDGSYLAQQGIPTVSFGPIREGTNYHGIDEFVFLNDISIVRDTMIEVFS